MTWPALTRRSLLSRALALAAAPRATRASFLNSAPRSEQDDAGRGLRIRVVDIIHHTHTDVGYTDLPAVVRDQQKRYIDAAIDACKNESTFRWTIESLLELDDWWRAASAPRRRELMDLVGMARMDVMGMPFNQTPFLNAMQWRQMMSWIPSDLWRSLGIRAAMQNDVNGFPRAGALALLDHGVNHFLMGLNADSGGPPFRRPTAFWWKLPDGRRLFVWLGEHYGIAMSYLLPAINGDQMRTDEHSVRAAHAEFTKRLRAIESAGYNFDRLILTFTHPLHWDNGSPFPALAPFVAAWNSLGLAPLLRLSTATEAVFEMEKATGNRIGELQGEWTDWWANGDASGPREVAASRLAKRYLAAAMSPAFGPMPERAQPALEDVLRDLCLFDEHTWGAAGSISAPYSLHTLAQYVEKSDLAYRPMGVAEALLSRRVRAAVDARPEGVYVVNPAPGEISGWTSIDGRSLPPDSQSLVDVKTGERIPLQRDGDSLRFWVERIAPNSIEQFRADSTAVTASVTKRSPTVKLDPSGWPQSARWTGVRTPLFEGSLGEFLAVVVVPPADRRTIAELHANTDTKARERIRKRSLRETTATYEQSRVLETPHTFRYEQEIRHERLAQARRTLELWKAEPRARLSIRFDRLSSIAPEVFFIGVTLPGGLPPPVLSCGGVPFTPYRDQLKGSCRDYFAIDGWAHYRSGEGHWLWVTRDAPLVALGAPHVAELHQAEPANTNRILAMVFDNCWHTNFVADSHGVMEFQFELVWRERLEKPEHLAEALTAEPIVVSNPAAHEPPSILNNVYRP